MKWKMISVALLVAFLLAPNTPSQEATGGQKIAGARGSTAETSPAGQMYEDIEIMRRLLSGKLQAFAPPIATHVLASPYGKRVFGSLNEGTINTLDPLNVVNEYPANAPFAIYPNVYSGIANQLIWQRQGANLNRNGTWLRSFHRPWILASVAPSLTGEGTYLKGQGVIFTLTLPPPARDPRPEQPQPVPKPPSDWERIRKEVRQEKPQAEETAKPAKEPTLADVVLKVLAENGKHFTQLGPNESLTVAITFRKSEASVANATGVAFADYDNDGYPDVYFGTTFDDISSAVGLDLATVQAQQPPKEEKPASKPAAEDANGKKVKDLVLLGELHLKQGKTDEAIKVLRQALELKPEGEQAATANKHLVQALIAAQKYDEATQALQKAAEWLKKQQAETQPKKESNGAAQPSPLPSKLVITVPKKLLDDVGSGKMSFEDFKKAASVEYLTFAPEKK
jgi:hypothetical protein